MTIIITHSRFSNGARNLAKELGIRKVWKDKAKPRRELVINWGCSNLPPWVERGINNPRCVALASNKLSFFRQMELFKVPTVQYKDNIYSIYNNINNIYKYYIGRTTLSGSKGEGIVIIPSTSIQENPDQYKDIRLFTAYTPKSAEYRVHVAFGEVIMVQQKRGRKGFGDRTQEQKLIRSHDNGWVFTKQNVDLPPNAADVAIRCVRACGLDFGAVDLIIAKTTGEALALEVNTAPGLEGTSPQAYAAAFKKAGIV